MDVNKIWEYIKGLDDHDGVLLCGSFPEYSPFEKAYINIRNKEHRLYDDNNVMDLPYSNNAKPVHEWKMRAKSSERLATYFLGKKNPYHILDLGCGNGWFTGFLAKNTNLNLFGLDVNLIELKQGARLFNGSNISFLYGDIFKIDFPPGIIDAVTINAAIQYFPQLDSLFKRLFEILNHQGEIHIIDSPFYSCDEVSKARERTLEYYKSMNCTEMADHYFHHDLDDLKSWNYKFLYQPVKSNVIMNLFKKKDMPFPWIKIVR